MLRHLQTIRLGRLQMGRDVHHTTITDVPEGTELAAPKPGLGPTVRLAPKALDVARLNRENLGFVGLFSAAEKPLPYGHG